MATYFGLNDSSPDNVDFLSGGQTSYWRASGYSCPGSGSQTVKELSVYCDLQSGSVNIRLAIYSSDGSTLIGYGTAEVATTTTAGYQGHMSESAVQAAAGGSCTLTGGVTYRLVCADDQSSPILNYGYNNSVTSGVSLYTSADYTSGFPASLPSPEATCDYEWCIRCGVDPASSGKATRNTRSFPLGVSVGMKRMMGG